MRTAPRTDPRMRDCERSRISAGLRSRNSPGWPVVSFYLVFVLDYLVFVLDWGTTRPGRLLGLKLGPFMKIWWLVLMSRSRRDSATTGLGNRGYQSVGARLLVITTGRLPAARSDSSS